MFRVGSDQQHHVLCDRRKLTARKHAHIVKDGILRFWFAMRILAIERRRGQCRFAAFSRGPARYALRRLLRHIFADG
jgi:hypothetical protein